MQYLYKDVDDFLKDLADNQDFDCNKINSNKRKLIFIYELKEKCGCIGVTLQNEINDEDKLKYMNQYNAIFRNRDKTINMNNLVNLRKIFIKTIRNLNSLLISYSYVLVLPYLELNSSIIIGIYINLENLKGTLHQFLQRNYFK